MVIARKANKLSSAPYPPSYIDVLDKADHSDAPVADDSPALPDALVVPLDIVHTPEQEVVRRRDTPCPAVRFAVEGYFARHVLGNTYRFFKELWSLKEIQVP